MHFAIGFGVVAMAIGAILVFAVEASLSGIDLQVVGWILLIVGAAGALFGTLAASSALPGRRERVIER